MTLLFVRVYTIGVADLYSYDGPVYRKVVSTTNELASYDKVVIVFLAGITKLNVMAYV